MNICTLNKIAAVGLNRLGDGFTVTDKLDNADGVLVRSAAMHDMELPENLLAIARAGAGTNNIPIDKCTEKGIVVFNTPGANANGVKELVLGALIIASRNIVKATDWVKGLKGEGDAVAKLVEGGKSQFVGPEIKGKKLGIIGLGAIGVMVANSAISLGMDVYGYDPFISIDAAWNLKAGVKHCTQLSDIYANCDYITLHVPANADTKGMINKDAIAQMVDGVRILNFARGELVVADDILEATASGKIACYATDFPCDKLIGADNVVAIPHLGASTPESEDNCAVMAADQLRDYLVDGNIKNSVNFPAASLPRNGSDRVCIFHANIPGIIGSITSLAGDESINIANMLNKSRKDIAYTILDLDKAPSANFIEKLKGVDGVKTVRVIG